MTKPIIAKLNATEGAYAMNRNTKPVRQKNTKHNQKGFSLIEIMVVLVIIGILATVFIPNILNRPDQARAEKAGTDISAIKTALQLYRLDNGMYPSTEQGLSALVKESEIDPIPTNYQPGGYLGFDNVPKDPWGRDYIYTSPGANGENFVIISYGADGVEGGTGVEADISSNPKKRGDN